MEKKFNSREERVGYYMMEFIKAETGKEKANLMLDWYKSRLNSHNDTGEELYLFEKVEEELYYIMPDADEDFGLYEWYDANKCAISDECLERIRAN